MDYTSLHSKTPQPGIVWLIEDDPLYQATVSSILGESDGFVCEAVFESCEAAIAELRENDNPDVVLMDISLPGMNGVDGVREMKSLSPAIAIIMLTVHQNYHHIFEAVCAGASGYLLKPSSSGQLLEALDTVVSGGAPINPQIAAKVLSMFPQKAKQVHDYPLTGREREILELLVDGLTKKHIAGRLFLSYHTVDMHIRHIYFKLHVNTRTDAIVKAIKERLI